MGIFNLDPQADLRKRRGQIKENDSLYAAQILKCVEKNDVKGIGFLKGVVQSEYDAGRLSTETIEMAENAVRAMLQRAHFQKERAEYSLQKTLARTKLLTKMVNVSDLRKGDLNLHEDNLATYREIAKYPDEVLSKQGITREQLDTAIRFEEDFLALERVMNEKLPRKREIEVGTQSLQLPEFAEELRSRPDVKITRQRKE